MRRERMRRLKECLKLRKEADMADVLKIDGACAASRERKLKMRRERVAR